MLFHHSGEAIGWSWEPSILLGLALLTAAYFWIGRRLRSKSPEQPWSGWQRMAFHAGTGLVFIALVSPLDSLADHYLFSAHMGQHLLLMLAAPLLWLLGIPGWAAERLVPRAVNARLLAPLTQPAVAGLLWVGTMWIWHIPVLYQAALRAEPLHILEHLSFLGTGLIGWWPAFGPIPDAIRGRPQLRQALYLFFVTLPCTGLAAILTLASRPLYAFYADSTAQFGLTQLLDQQLGGLLMWLPGDMILAGATVVVISRWMNRAGLPAPPVRPLSGRFSNGV